MWVWTTSALCWKWISPTALTDAAELEAEVGPMAEIYAELPGLRWKIWIIDEDEKRFGAVYLFEDAEARTAYLESELGGRRRCPPCLQRSARHDLRRHG